jgi:hypothetical protein
MADTQNPNKRERGVHILKNSSNINTMHISRRIKIIKRTKFKVEDQAFMYILYMGQVELGGVKREKMGQISLTITEYLTS